MDTNRIREIITEQVLKYRRVTGYLPGGHSYNLTGIDSMNDLNEICGQFPYYISTYNPDRLYYYLDSTKLTGVVIQAPVLVGVVGDTLDIIFDDPILDLDVSYDGIIGNILSSLGAFNHIVFHGYFNGYLTDLFNGAVGVTSIDISRLDIMSAKDTGAFLDYNIGEIYSGNNLLNVPRNIQLFRCSRDRGVAQSSNTFGSMSQNNQRDVFEDISTKNMSIADCYERYCTNGYAVSVRAQDLEEFLTYYKYDIRERFPITDIMFESEQYFGYSNPNVLISKLSTDKGIALVIFGMDDIKSKIQSSNSSNPVSCTASVYYQGNYHFPVKEGIQCFLDDTGIKVTLGNNTSENVQPSFDESGIGSGFDRAFGKMLGF